MKSLDPSELLKLSMKALEQRAENVETMSNIFMVGQALSSHWLEMTTGLLQRANERINEASNLVEKRSEANGGNISFDESAAQFQSAAVENLKDMMNQLQRFSMSAGILAAKITKTPGES